ncbi:hypothetical protein ACN27E_24995 [Mycobacterium sp. WMMD1722]|uniref:hypothetical protein n=1 Tax=Mycobacterium sp. WMMD1722 TaxID=3404117 RepID=UPI003BF554A7
MTKKFVSDVQSVIGPLMTDLGFVLDGVDDSVDEGGRTGAVVFYRRWDCKLQIYWSAREFEINVMIAPGWAPNEHGLYDRSAKWHYLTEFVPRPDVPLEQLVKMLRADRANFESDTTWLMWLKERIAENFAAAHLGVLHMYDSE